MSDAVKRTQAWREQQRENGYQCVTIWMPGRIKELMVRLAFEQRRDLGVVIADACQAYAQTKGVKPSALVDRRQMEALIDERIAQALASQRPAPTAPPAPALPPALPPIPEGMKRCAKGHQYPAHKKECLQCATLRKRKSRKSAKDQRQGALPT